ncbi:uncharacterized protein TRAVEDRAFT_49410 [Trametes versicolor FP-101664 SS1]|uniref:uncharacterized protein n=1 Tax=Trametes versicolor (strain FP-101664) TaxID=717944 RepID=UPI0004622B49|nr:uncharacterized protein TRAVEDRAFT_49410 [Trametes versicolor FP-101664 SS1]EIW56591.1 hypothetical protein TRAVEDRAFT_49410 [Trametes versicolor FP-101664 SS1]
MPNVDSTLEPEVHKIVYTPGGRAMDGFRKTRSGAAFSPWETDFGTPIHAPLDFELETRIKEAVIAADAKYEAATADEEGSDFEGASITALTADRAPGNSLQASAPTGGTTNMPPSLTLATHAHMRSQLAHTPSLAPAPASIALAPASVSLTPVSAAAAASGPALVSLTPASVSLAPAPVSLAPAPVSLAPASVSLAPASVSLAPVLAAPAPPPNASASEKAKYHNKHRSKARRREKRATLSSALGTPGIGKSSVKAVAAKRRSAAVTLTAGIALESDVVRTLHRDNGSVTAKDALPIETRYSLAMEDVPVAKTAFIGQRYEATEADRAEVTKEDLLARKFRYIPWDGRECRPILDKNGRLGPWDTINTELQAIFETTREAYSFNRGQLDHRRGDFPAVTSGISFGGGQKYIKNISQRTSHNENVVSALLGQTAVRRVANFGNSAMRLFAPRLHGYYSTTLNALCAKHPTLRPNFSNNVFGTATFNLGPRTVSYAHVDQKNLPWGWCTITAAGEFDPVCSGHLILWDLKMFIEFPPGATVLIPSALLCHSNTTIAPHERRYSFTQYTAGGIVRWMESGFQPDLNTALAAWGCPDDPRTFIQDLDCGLQGAEDDGGLPEWIEQTEQWVMDGDQVLDSVQSFISDGTMASFGAEELGRIWGGLSAAVFKMQYVMAAVERVFMIINGLQRT